MLCGAIKKGRNAQRLENKRVISNINQDQIYLLPSGICPTLVN